MIDYQLDLTGYPAFLHRIVSCWYVWQLAQLRSQDKYPGYKQREPRFNETRDQIIWGARPPEMTRANELGFIDDADVSFFLTWEAECYYIDTKERGSRNTYWMFTQYEDAEKYLLYVISKLAFPGRYSLAMRWREEGLDPRVTLSKPDPVNYPGRVSLRVNGEAQDRGWMGETDATAVSHIVFLSFEELDSLLREGLSPQWFAMNTQGE